MNLRSILTHQSPACFLTPFPPTKLTLQRANISSYKNNQYCHQSTHSNTITARRSADYKPSMWDFNFVQSLKSEYKGLTYEKQSNKLKEAVRRIFDDKENMTVQAQSELIDTVEKLGVGYLFKNEIKRSLDNIYQTMNQLNSGTDKEDLHSISLYFRLLRQHGYEVSQDVFIGFMKDDTSNLKSTDNNIKGMLSLYEASHLGLEGETLLDEAKIFTSKYLNKAINEDNYLSPEVVKRVKHSLELPMHWRMQRLEARWYIDNISAKENVIYQDLLKLAKLDYNMVQAIYQEDLREMSDWWTNLGLGSELSFARDRLMEYFLWSVGMTSDSWFSNSRKSLTKFAALVTIIDDVYDVYGTLDELELFTDAVDRWDINAMELLPHYMKICFLALYNTINDTVYNILKDKHLYVIRYLKQTWGDLCKAQLQEAKWCYNKYTPTFEEYLDNALTSVGGPLILAHVFFLLNSEITEVELEYLDSKPHLIGWTSTICRLCNDLEPASQVQDEVQRGDVPKSIQCYMNDNNVSKEVAVGQIRNMISEIWKKINKDLMLESSPFSKRFAETAADLLRVTNLIYKYGNGYGYVDWETKEQVLALLVDPISLEESANTLGLGFGPAKHP